MKKLLIGLALLVSVPSLCQIKISAMPTLPGVCDTCWVAVVKGSTNYKARANQLFTAGGGGSGNTNSNIGSGYRWAVPFTNDIKTAFPGLWILIDSSSNSNGLTFKIDSASEASYFVRRKDSVPGGYYPYSTNPKNYLTENFYTANGTVTSNRTVDLNNKTLTFNNGHDINFNLTSGYPFNVDAGGVVLNTSSVSGGGFISIQPTNVLIDAHSPFYSNASTIEIDDNFIELNQYFGNVKIDNLAVTSDNSGKDLMIINSTTGLLERLPFVSFNANVLPVHFTGRQIFLNKDSTYKVWYNGDSYTGYYDNEILDLYFGKAGVSFAFPGASSQDSYEALIANIPFKGTVDGYTIMSGYNEATRGTNKRGGKEEFANNMHAIVANWFLQADTWIAGNDGTLTYTGTWDTSYPDDSSSFKSQFKVGGGGHSKQSMGSGDKVSWTTPYATTSIVFGTGATSGNNWFGTDSLEVKIDGVSRGKWCFDSCMTGIADFGFNQIKSNKKGPVVLVFQGLTLATHTIEVIKGTNTSKKLAIDFFGQLQRPDTAKFIAVMGVPTMPAASYATYMGLFGGTLNDDVVKSYNTAAVERLREFSYFPIAYGDINEDWRPTRDVGGDGVHPNGNGAFRIGEVFVNLFRKVKDSVGVTSGFVPTSRTISTTSPLAGGGDLSANRTISIANAAADGSTLGAAAFTASDFNSSAGVISLDYANGQKASGSVDGFLSTGDWTTFNNKVGTARTINTTSPLSGGGDLSADRTISIANADADGSTKGAASFTAADFNASSGNISIDYTNGQSASTTDKGFLTPTDWNTFNSKVGSTRTINTTSPLAGGGDLSADRTLSIADAVADGTTKGAASFTAADFNSSSGNVSIDYTNGQSASTSNKGFLSNTDWNTFNGKQDALVSGTNIKTINGSSVLGSGNLVVSATAAGGAGQIQFNTSGALDASANLTYSSGLLKVIGTSFANGDIGAENNSSVGASLALDATGTSGRRYFLISTSTGAGSGGGKFAIYDDDNAAYTWWFDNTDFLTQTTVSSSTVGAGILLKPTATGGREYAIIASANGAGSGGGRLLFYDQTATAIRMTMDADGQLGIGVTTPTAFLHLAAGTSTANTAPLKFESGTNLGTAEAGVIEFNGDFYRTKANAVRYGDVGSLKVNTSDVGNVGAGEDDLMTYSVPAGTLSADGDYIEYEMTFTFAANANNKQVKIYYGGTTVYASGAAAQNGGTMTVLVRVIRTGATTQDVSYKVVSNSTLFNDLADYTTAGETLSGAVTVKATGEATSNNDIIQKILTVKYFSSN